MADDDKAGRNVLQYLGDILAQLVQRAAAIRACLAGRKVRLYLSRQMFRQWTPFPGT